MLVLPSVLSSAEADIKYSKKIEEIFIIIHYQGETGKALGGCLYEETAAALRRRGESLSTVNLHGRRRDHALFVMGQLYPLDKEHGARRNCAQCRGCYEPRRFPLGLEYLSRHCVTILQLVIFSFSLCTWAHKILQRKLHCKRKHYIH